MRSITSGVAVMVVLATMTSTAKEIGYLEDFVLAPDRTVPLQQLIPGTEDYYYYHCLHYQNTEQFDKTQQMLKKWIARYQYTPRVREIQNRQTLLTYPRNPQASLDQIQKQLRIRFDHQRTAVGAKPDLPTRLDPQRISRERLDREARGRHKNLQGYEDSALEWLVREQLNPDQRRNLLERLVRPDYPDLPRLIAGDLKYKGSRGFGSLAIHRQLLRSQLDECLKLKPDLLNQPNFVTIYLSKLQPSPDVDWRHDRRQHEAYLARLWQFVRRLAPAHNSLKAHVLYHWLVLDRAHGTYDKQRLMDYIKLPRSASYVSRQYVQRVDQRRFLANLRQDFRGVTQLPAVGDDRALVTSYLHHFFLQETTYQPYVPYLDETYLKHQFAETKIVHGLGDPEQWYSMLPPAAYQQLKQRVDLDFAYTNKTVLTADEPVRLDLHVKNVRDLIVKVFEVHTGNYYRQYGREVNTDINLDGLVANQQKTYHYTDPAVRRAERHFEFPSLGKPGVYVIDFIGNGKSSRAVLRKGKLHYVARTSTAGQVLTILDSNQRKVNDATLWLRGHQFHAGDDGTITIPFSNQPGRQPIVLTQGDFSSLQYLEQQPENYTLSAGIYVDREALLAQRKAQVLVRPGLLLNGVPVTLSVLEDVRLSIRSTDHDGVATTKQIEDFKLHEDHESIYPFQVPQRTSQITVTLTAKVQNASQGKKVELATSDTFKLNEIDGTDKVEDVHLTRTGEDYSLEVLGKTGEPRANRPVRLSLKHRDFRQPVELSLQTDDHGRILLGPLDGIATITAAGPAGTSHSWPVIRDRHTYLSSLHGVAESTVEVPYMGPEREPDRGKLSLLELRGNTFVADRFDALSLRGGMLRAEGLPAGDYDLLLKESGRRIRLRLAQGPVREGYVLGDRRQLEVRGDKSLQIGRIEQKDDQLVVQLRHATPFSRVHVFATYYQPAYDAMDLLARVGDIEPYRVEVPKLRSLYVQGRDIGDEYRYIIDRKHAAKFPGNMLDRPGLLINPWAIRKTETGQQQAAAGDAFSAKPESESAAAARSPAKPKPPTGPSDFANLDFLAEATSVRLNLRPDDHGRVTIPRQDLAGHALVHVVAVDPRNTVYRSISLPSPKPQTLDLRLAAGLDPEVHYTQRKQITAVAKGGTFHVADVTSARLEVYDSLAKVHALYSTLSGDSKMAEFRFVLDWPDMTDKQKRAKYSKYACHELNFFLMKKDPAFFQRVVKPYLANKKDKTLLDRWLIGDDLHPYLSPWSYARLNVVERILLAQRIDGEKALTARHVQDLFDLAAPDMARQNHLFDTALAGSSLEAQTRYGMMGGGLGGVAGAIKQRRLLETEGMSDRLGLATTRGRPTVRAHAAARPAAPPALAANGRMDDRAEKAVAELTRKKAAPARRGAAALELKDKAFFARDAAKRELARQFYRRLDKTQEWVENNYYQLPIEKQNAKLVTVNAFWNDYAHHAAPAPFVSTHLAEASGSFPEMMFALAVLDLPFHAKPHDTQQKNHELTLTAAGPMIVFHQQVQPIGKRQSETPILVSENFFRHGDRYQYVHNQRQDKFVTDEFLVHTVYGCQVVVTNPTSAPQTLDLLLQIPAGAIPVLNGHYTRNVSIHLQPFHTQTVEYQFYFPATGQYRHYPVQVAKNEQLLAHAAPVTLHVVEQLTQVDRQSWDYVSQNATDDQVLDFLDKNNVNRVVLGKIAFRMRDKKFFLDATRRLSRRHVYDQTLWSYGIKHNVVPAIREYLQHADQFVAQCGSYLDSPLLVIDPVVRKTYQHMEYRPLVNARAHQLSRRRQILNDRFYDQYHRLLKVLSYRRELDDDDLMSIVYCLLLQDRVEQAMVFFQRVQPDRLATKLQYDYFAAYLDLYTANLDHARAIADRYADYPVDRWRKAFARVSAELDEIAGASVQVVDKENRTDTLTERAATEPSFQLKVEGQKVRIDYQNLRQVDVRYYLMDIELLFSRNPFVQHHAGQFSNIRPNHQQVVPLPAGQSTLTLDLPKSLRNRNVLIEISGGGQTKTQSHYSNSMTLLVMENYGQLRVTRRDNGKPISKVYVKVYARLKDGNVRFYKDGYTDLRGRFDYTSLSTNELDFVEKLSLLVFSDDYGAVVREVDPPKE